MGPSPSRGKAMSLPSDGSAACKATPLLPTATSRRNERHSGRASRASTGEREPESSNQSGSRIHAGRELLGPGRASPVEPGSLGRDDSPYAIALPPLGGGITPQDPSRRFHFGKTGRAAIERKSVFTPELHIPVLVHIGCRPGPIERHCTLRDRKRDECRSGDGRDGMHGSQSPRMARNGGPDRRNRPERLFDVDQPVSERKACAQRLIGPLEDGVPGGSLPLDQSFRLVSAIEYEI